MGHKLLDYHCKSAPYSSWPTDTRGLDAELSDIKPLFRLHMNREPSAEDVRRLETLVWQGISLQSLSETIQAEASRS